ncbi:gamma-glutamyl-gamma-aminobutyrate hydrolase family protein [bacterium]|nr:gamma-glutamyl-gamma-aminobutyrate hydrolase family protein [Methanomicrobia archaeon]MCD6148271.1 gamma-glutamyl-gamma-aminobutyrate hydrolase family protein [bacterium]
MILIIDMCYKRESLSKNEFVDPVVDIVSCKKSYIVKHFLELKEEDIFRAEKIILCGTALKDNEFMNHIEKFYWIRDTEKYILGICAGMEVISLVFGGKLRKETEIGMREINVRIDDPLFEGRKNFSAYELHNYSVDKLDQFLILAESENSIQAIRHREKKIYGLMFHPEVRNKKIISTFVDL